MLPDMATVASLVQQELELSTHRLSFFSAVVVVSPSVVLALASASQLGSRLLASPRVPSVGSKAAKLLTKMSWTHERLSVAHLWALLAHPCAAQQAEQA